MPRYFVPETEDSLRARLIDALTNHDEYEDGDDFNGFSYIRSLTPQIEKDLAKCQFDTENVMCCPRDNSMTGYHTLRNGLTYLGIFAGGDWEQGVFFIIYWDGKKLRAYVPTKGNPYNHTTKEAYGNDTEDGGEDILDQIKQGYAKKGDEYQDGIPDDPAAVITDIESRLLPMDKV